MAAPRPIIKRLTFQARAAGEDEFGNVNTGEWANCFTTWAYVTPAPGVETLTAQRLQGTNPVSVYVDKSSLTAPIRPDWRAVDAYHPEDVYAITSKIEVAGGRPRYLLTCTLGGVP